MKMRKTQSKEEAHPFLVPPEEPPFFSSSSGEAMALGGGGGRVSPSWARTSGCSKQGPMHQAFSEVRPVDTSFWASPYSFAAPVSVDRSNLSCTV